MKHLVVLFFSLLFFIHSYPQKAADKKSNTIDAEMIVGGVLLGGGFISVATGLLSKGGNAVLQSALNDNSKNTAGNTFLIVGAASIVVGALLLIDGTAREKKRFHVGLDLPKYTYPNIYSHIATLSLSVRIGK
jgi:uncharacterized membrane-anchored protein YitT (DUF2179 family)